MKKNRIRKRDILKVLLIAAFAGLMLFAAYKLLNQWDQNNNRYPSEDNNDWRLETTLEYEGVQYQYNEDIETLLVVGLDKFSDTVENDSYYNDQQSDFLLLFIMDNKNKTVSAIQINRDTMAQIHVLGVAGQKIDTVTGQIALAHTYGNGQMVSLRNTADAVSDLLFGIKVDHCISATMDVVQKVNDAVGGVTVEVLNDLTAIDSELVKGQQVKLMGQQVLSYVRGRQGVDEPTNEARMQRQRQYMNALYQQLAQVTAEDDSFAMELLMEISEDMLSNLTVDQMQTVLNKALEYEFGQIYIPEGESKVGEEFMEFYPDQDKLKKLMVDLFYLKA